MMDAQVCEEVRRALHSVDSTFVNGDLTLTARVGGKKEVRFSGVGDLSLDAFRAAYASDTLRLADENAITVSSRNTKDGTFGVALRFVPKGVVPLVTPGGNGCKALGSAIVTILGICMLAAMPVLNIVAIRTIPGFGEHLFPRLIFPHVIPPPGASVTPWAFDAGHMLCLLVLAELARYAVHRKQQHQDAGLALLKVCVAWIVAGLAFSAVLRLVPRVQFEVLRIGEFFAAMGWAEYVVATSLTLMLRSASVMGKALFGGFFASAAAFASIAFFSAAIWLKLIVVQAGIGAFVDTARDSLRSWQALFAGLSLLCAAISWGANKLNEKKPEKVKAS